MLFTAFTLALAGGAAVADNASDDASTAPESSATSSIVLSGIPSAPAVADVIAGSTSEPATTDPATTDPATTDPATTDPATTDPATTDPATTDSAVEAAEVFETREIGRSVEDRPIVGERRGTPGGKVVLIVGVIHGDENDSLSIMDRLHELDVPAGVDLWLVDSMNPDGYAADTRQNANGVDLNRNFPYHWSPIGELGDWQYAGRSEASEPETRAMTSFLLDIRPDLTIWYHQDYYRVSPSTGRDRQLRKRYTELSGIPLLPISGGTYTGTAATWTRERLDPAMSFVVELGPTLTDTEADRHAHTVLTLATELR